MRIFFKIKFLQYTNLTIQNPLSFKIVLFPFFNLSNSTATLLFSALQTPPVYPNVDQAIQTRISLSDYSVSNSRMHFTFAHSFPQLSCLFSGTERL
jgi:hypothetical protein